MNAHLIILMLSILALGGMTAVRAASNVADDAIEIDEDGYAQLQAWLDQRLAASEGVIRIPPGTYRLRPVQMQHLVLRGLRDVKIVADGVEIIATETTRVLTIQDCENLSISGLKIDFDPLPFTQGRIVEMSEDKLEHVIELDAGYPTTDTVQPLKYEIYHATEHRLLWGDYFEFQIEAISPTRMKIRKADRFLQVGPNMEQVGDRIVIGSTHAPNGSIPHAIYIERSSGTVLEDVTLYSSNMFGFFEMRSSGSKYIRCNVIPRPLESDPLNPSTARLRSGHADAFHSKHARVGPTYIECRMGYMADDGIAINTDYHVAVAIDEDRKTLAVLAKRADELHLQPGEELEIWSANGTMIRGNKVVSARLVGPADEARREPLMSLPIRPQWKAAGGVMVSQEWSIELETALPDDVEMPLFIGSVLKRGDGAVIRNCQIGPTRSRGILVKSSNIEIRDNTITDTLGVAIKMAPEVWWLEAGHSNNVTIAGNEISRVRTSGIQVISRNGLNEFSPAGAHSNITIEQNQFEAIGGPAIQISSATGLHIEGNTRIDRSETGQSTESPLPPQAMAIDQKTVEMSSDED